MPNQKHHATRLIPYEGLAFFYDQLMAHVNYRQWSHHIKNIFSLKDKKIHSLVDLSCGTGSHILSLWKLGTIVYAADLSLPMLKKAREKEALPNNIFINASFCALPFPGHKFDAALALYDSANYLIGDKEVMLFLHEARRILNPGGLLIFDVVTPHTCIKYFTDYKESHFDREGMGYQRKSRFDQRHDLQYNDFVIKYNGQTFKEKHKQRIRSIEQWAALVEDVFGEDYEILGDFSLRPPQANAERVHFVCEKK